MEMSLGAVGIRIPAAPGWGLGAEYEVMLAQSPASKAESRHFPPPAPPSSPARAGVCSSY